MCESETTRDADERCSTAVLDIGGTTGALVIFANDRMLGREIEICPKGDPAARSHNVVRARQAPLGVVHAAIFPTLSEDDYSVLDDSGQPLFDVFVSGGAVTEVDVR
ncbi:MAG: hypothetical protein WAM97_11695 [Acidimicrobiales bacterium]|jgi:hypothetical protein